MPKSSSYINPVSGARIKEQIRARHLKQCDLAKEINISQKHLSNIISGRKALTLENALLLSEKLGVRYAYLLGLDDYPTEEDVAVPRRWLQDGERLKEICESKGITITDLAERIGYDPAQLHNITSAKSTRSISKNMARKIKGIFPDIRLEYLLGIDEYMTQENLNQSKVEVTLMLKGSRAEIAEFFDAIPNISIEAGDSFAQVFSTLLEATKTSNSEIAELLQISPQAVSNYRNGLAEPSIERLIKIADFFNVSLDFLMARSFPAQTS